MAEDESYRQSRRRGVTGTYAVFDTPTICAAHSPESRSVRIVQDGPYMPAAIAADIAGDGDAALKPTCLHRWISTQHPPTGPLRPELGRDQQAQDTPTPLCTVLAAEGHSRRQAAARWKGLGRSGNSTAVPRSDGRLAALR